MDSKNTLNYKNSEFFEEEEINIMPFVNSILRGKKFIFIVGLISIILNIFYANGIKPTYRGSFEILVSDTSTKNLKM